MSYLERYSDEALDELRVQVLTEQERRHTIATADEQIDHIVAAVAIATGRVDGMEWVQPKGVSDSYPRAARVMHGGKLWCSTSTANLSVPGQDAEWVEVPVEAEPA